MKEPDGWRFSSLRNILLSPSLNVSGGVVMYCFSFDAETHHPAPFDSFVDSINGVCLQGFLGFLCEEVIVGTVLASVPIWMLLQDRKYY